MTHVDNLNVSLTNWTIALTALVRITMKVIAEMQLGLQFQGVHL